MKDVFIVCRMMESEALAALRDTGKDPEVIWLEKRLHDRPETLRSALQEAMDKAEGEFAPERVLLGYGFCGNAMAGLRTGSYTLILPRIDDCVTLFIGSRERKAALEGGVGTLFQTSCWSDSDKTLLAQRDALLEQYDEEDALDIFEAMYGHYGRIGVLDTRCYPLEPVLEETRRIAAELGFEHRVYDASNEYLRTLLTGPWDEKRFVVKGPGEIVTLQDLRI